MNVTKGFLGGFFIPFLFVLSRFASRCRCLGISIVLGTAAVAYGTTPQDELLRLVPDDAGFCAVVRNLRTQVNAFFDTPLARKFRASALGQELIRSNELKKLFQVECDLKDLGIDKSQLREIFLDTALVFAYRPSPPGTVDQDEVLFLLRARNEQVLAKLVENIFNTEKKSGYIEKRETRRHRGVVYYRGLKDKEEIFYYVNGPMLAVSSFESYLQQIIDRDRKVPGAGESVVARKLKTLGTQQAALTIWVNPRAFDSQMAHNAANSKGAEAAALTALLKYWKALDGAALSLFLDKDPRLQLVVQARTEALPRAARRFLAAAARPSELWDRFPADAMVTLACRCDFAALEAMLGDFLTPDCRKAWHESLQRNLGAHMGKEFIKEVLPYLGPDCGLCIVAPPAANPAWFPHVLLALRIRQDKGTPQVEEALLTAVQFAAQWAVLSYNRQQADTMSLKTISIDKTEVKYLTGCRHFPPGFQPAFACRGGYLIVASSPEALQRFAVQPRRPAKPNAEIPLLRISTPEICRYLKERREVISLRDGIVKDCLFSSEGMPQLDKLVEILQLFDRLELVQSSKADQLTLTLRLQSSPLPK